MAYQHPRESRRGESCGLMRLGIAGVHLLALLAFVPWLFSWTGVALAFAGLVCVRHAGHQSLLPSLADAPRF